MTLEQLEQAVELATTIRRLRQSVEQWSKQGVPLLHLLNDTDRQHISRDDEIVFIEKTRDRMCRKLDEAERLFAAFSPTP